VLPLHTRFLGRRDYAEVAALQEATRRAVLAGGDEQLFFVEHEPVITLGRSADRDNVVASSALLERRGVAVLKSSRGGDVTYHGPGQLVVYPIVRLRAGVIDHVSTLAQAAADVAATFGIAAAFDRGTPGVWVGRAKLAALGVHVHRRVTVHGLALNVTTDLDHFALIVPCGLPGAKATSIAALTGQTPALDVVARAFANAYCARLQREPIWS
jgi:lipoyl(octanoyl) transferase